MEKSQKSYEGMFLFDAGKTNLEAAKEIIQNILTRSEGKVLSLKPWDERKLAYDISGCKRGLYVLMYFEVDPVKVVEIEHDCRLNENILRVLVLRRENLTPEIINADTPATGLPQKEIGGDEERFERKPVEEPIPGTESDEDIATEAK